MKTSKLFLAAALAAAASVAVGGGAQTVENMQTMQATQVIQVAQAQGKSTKAKKTGKKKVQGGACAGRYVGEKLTLTANGMTGTFRVKKVFPETGEVLAQCLTFAGQSCADFPPSRLRC